MFLHDEKTDALVEILDVQLLFDPTETTIAARSQHGQEEQDPEQYDKSSLKFPSGESLPQCWLDADYRTKNASEN
jgi:hypothetical protein